MTKHLSNQSFSEIPAHRPTQFSRRGDAEPRHRQSRREQKDGHMTPLDPGTPLVNTLKVCPPPDVLVTAERVRHGLSAGPC